MVEERAVRNLFSLDIIRGHHSSGIITKSVSGQVRTAKELGTPYELYETKEYQDATRQPLNLFACHNRFATRGNLYDVDNAHPFITANLIGMHNGTLRNEHELDGFFRYDTDSEALFNHMDANGLNDTLKTTDGAYALVWYDYDQDTINFVRNKDRPLHYVFTKDMKTLFWASEEWMLHVALSRNNIAHYKVCELPVHTHFHVPVPQGVKNNVDKFTKVRMTETEKYVPKYTGYSNGYTPNHSGGGGYPHNRQGGGTNRPPANTSNYKGSTSPGASWHDLRQLKGQQIRCRYTCPSADKSDGTPFIRFCADFPSGTAEVRVYALDGDGIYEIVRKEGLGSEYTLTVKKISKDQKSHKYYILGKRGSVVPASKEDNKKEEPSQIEDMKLDGTLCRTCEVYLGTSPSGIPRQCSDCINAKFKGGNKSEKKESGESKGTTSPSEKKADFVLVDKQGSRIPDVERSTRIEEALEEEYFSVYRGIFISGTELLKRAKEGCALCGQTPLLEFADEYLWVDTETYFCGECKETSFAKEWAAAH